MFKKKKQLLRLLVSTPYGSFSVLFPSKESEVVLTFVYSDDSERKVKVFDPEQVSVIGDAVVSQE